MLINFFCDGSTAFVDYFSNLSEAISGYIKKRCNLISEVTPSLLNYFLISTGAKAPFLFLNLNYSPNTAL